MIVETLLVIDKGVHWQNTSTGCSGDNMARRIAQTLLICLAFVASALAFAPTHSHATSKLLASTRGTRTCTAGHCPQQLMMAPSGIITSSIESSSNIESVATLDPTTALSDALGGVLGSSLILAVPIVAALSVAGLIAFLIVSYANPADED